jgi:hypothetical protein
VGGGFSSDDRRRRLFAAQDGDHVVGQRDGQLGGRVRQDAGRVRRAQAALADGIRVDVVDADGSPPTSTSKRSVSLSSPAAGSVRATTILIVPSA